jgi:hypothetical protein
MELGAAYEVFTQVAAAILLPPVEHALSEELRLGGA